MQRFWGKALHLFRGEAHRAAGFDRLAVKIQGVVVEQVARGQEMGKHARVERGVGDVPAHVLAPVAYGESPPVRIVEEREALQFVGNEPRFSAVLQDEGEVPVEPFGQRAGAGVRKCLPGVAYERLATQQVFACEGIAPCVAFGSGCPRVEGRGGELNVHHAKIPHEVSKMRKQRAHKA